MIIKTKNSQEKLKKSINLKTKEYSESKRPSIDNLKLAKKDLAKFFDQSENISDYAWSVLSEFLLYTLNHAREISNDLVSIDSAMRNGFGLQFGPFELMDKLGKTWIKNKLLTSNKIIPSILEKLEGETFYKKGNNKLQFYDFNKNEFIDLKRPEGIIILSDIKKINDINTFKCVVAERTMLKTIEGDCDTAVGGLATIKENIMTLKCELFSVDGKKRYFVTVAGNVEEGKEIGIKAGKQLIAQAGNTYKK